MYRHFIYFIVVLLIFATYQPPEEANFTFAETGFFFFFLILLYTVSIWMLFFKIKKQIIQNRFFHVNHAFEKTVTRFSTAAIVLTALNIYGLSLPSFLIKIRLLSAVPTLHALIFIGLFVLYLSIGWALAYDVYKRLNENDLSRPVYILSNIAYSLPVLLPWVIISGLSDILNLLPFEGWSQFISSPLGEISYFLVALVTIAMIGPAVIQTSWRCKPLESGEVRTRIEALCRQADVTYKEILYWPIFGGRMITAGVMGLVKRFRYILITGGLIRFLEPREIDAVIAHEIGHIKKKHLFFYLIFFLGYMLISYAAFDLIIYFILISKPISGLIGNAGLNQTTVIPVIFSMTIILMFIIYFRFVFGYFMRNFERQADTYVYRLFESARPLISTFEKIARISGQPPDRPNWHHFSINQRKAYLLKCEQDKKWVERQDKKVNLSILVYVVCMVIVGLIGYAVNFGETGKTVNTRFFEKILLEEIEKDPGNAHLFSTLGDLYYQKKDYEKTIAAYKQSLLLEPNGWHALNNLAWLYAVCDQQELRNQEAALILAKKAAALHPSPQILDTLAESCFINGLYDQAVEAATRALLRAEKNAGYYEKRLEKFKKAQKQRQTELRKRASGR